MRFRVTHLLVAMVVIALFATPLASPTDFARSVVNLGAWFVYAAIVVRALARPAERLYLAAALIFGLSYLLAATFDMELVTERILWSIGYERGLNSVTTGPNQVENFVPNFAHIGHVALSFVFALIGALLAAFWSRPPRK